MRLFFLFSLSMLIAFNSLTQLTIVLDQVPANTPEVSNIHIAGSFQGWIPSDASYILEETIDGDFEITIDPPVGELVFKFTRGDWETPEGNENGGFLPDRTFSYDGLEQVLTLQILSWEDIGGTNSTAADNVSILDTNYPIPELDRERRVWVYLPPDYDSAPEKYYPVLYIHDGQNVFDAATSFSGEWEVDESLNTLHENGDYGCIVIAIDNGGAYRLDEYSPWINTQYGGGQGDDYMQFIINTLKPDIDNLYRTRTERDFTGIMGSSMGGLISMYGGMEYSTVFSKIGSLSPAYWFSEESIPHVENSSHEDLMRVYTIIGEQEGAGAVQDVVNMDEAMLESGLSAEEFITTIHSDGAHSEWYWSREFSDAYEWLFADINLSLPNSERPPQVLIYPNPSDDFIFIKGHESIASLRIIDITGRIIYHTSEPTDSVEVSSFASGKYLINYSTHEGEMKSLKWSKL